MLPVLSPLSRLLNVITTLRLSAWHEHYCTRMLRENPSRAARIDALWTRLGGYPGHCQRCAAYDECPMGEAYEVM